MARYEQEELTENSIAEEARSTSVPCSWCKASNALVKNGTFSCQRCSYECDISTPPEICVIGWTTANDNSYPNYDYCTKEIYNALVKEIKEKGYSFGWGSHQSRNLPCTPVINNGYKICCGPRTWGWIMAEANGEDGEDENAYVAYSFLDPSDKIAVYPKKQVDRRLIVPFEIEDE